MIFVYLFFFACYVASSRITTVSVHVCCRILPGNSKAILTEQEKNYDCFANRKVITSSLKFSASKITQLIETKTNAEFFIFQKPVSRWPIQYFWFQKCPVECFETSQPRGNVENFRYFFIRHILLVKKSVILLTSHFTEFNEVQLENFKTRPLGIVDECMAVKQVWA